VSQGISESYLRWRGIEATLLLAQSPNSKVVVIGSGRDGLPIILNAEPNAPGGASQSNGNAATTGGQASGAAGGSAGSGGAPGGNSSGPPSNTAPASSGAAPPSSSSAPGSAPGAPVPPPNKPAPGTSGAVSTPQSEQTASANTSSGATQQGTLGTMALDIPGVRSILSGISGALRAGANLTSPEATSKQ